MQVWEVHPRQGAEALQLTERPIPSLLPGQVLLKMKAASLNYRDLLTVRGAHTSPDKPPFIPLSDGVGEVVAVGEGVTRVNIGDRVAGIFMQAWISGGFSAEKSKSALGGAIAGILSEYAVLHEAGVVHIPAHLSDVEAASLPCAAVTAWHALMADGTLKPGDTILIQGSGGVSLFALQFANIVGAKVIATSSRDQKLERLMQLGAACGVNYQTDPAWEKTVFKLTNKGGVDRVIEVAGANTLNQSLRAVRYGGHISLIGVLSGFSAEISTVTILHKGIRLQGIYVGSRDMFEQMNRAIALHQIKPIIDRVFPFADIHQALDYMESGSHFGKIAIQFP